MNRIILSLVLAFLFVSTTSFDPNNGVYFHSGSFNSIKFKAKSEKKLILLDFYADWCFPCKMMDKSTFKDSHLARYIDDNFIAHKINIEHIEGIPHKNWYKVKVLPTMVVVDEDGIEIKRFEEGMSSAKLLRALQEIIGNHENGEVSNISTQADKIKNTITETFTAKDKIEEPEVTEISNEIEPVAKDKITEPKAALETGLFEFDVTPITKTGYGVQIGTYGNYGNVLRESNMLKTRFRRKVVVHITNLGEKPVYRVILGNFNTRGEAEGYKAFMEKKEIYGYVVDLAIFK